jgi:hypothetical protein
MVSSRERLTPYLLSLPERALRSATAVSAGFLREIGDVTIPKSVRQSQLYQNLVDSTLRFLIEQVGQVENVYPQAEAFSEEFLMRRTAGNGIELIGILAFRASPVWVLAALADVTGAGRYLIRDIADSLKDQGLLERSRDFTSVDQMLDGLEATAGRLASTINTPPLDVATLRQDWESVKNDLSKIPPRNFPSVEDVRGVWTSMKDEARRHNRTVFELSSVMAMSAVTNLPQRVRWISASTRVAMGRTSTVLAGVLLDHYRSTLREIRQAGYLRYAVRQFRPYLYAAASQFSPRRQSLTERVLRRKKQK